MITVKITAGGKSTVQGTGKWSYAWINNAGETAIYATTEWGTQTVTERIAEYEAGGAKDIVKLPTGSSKRLRANNRPVIIFGAEAGMAEVDLTNTDVSPFKVQAKGGDDGNIEPISITANGTYTASGDVKGYSPVNVNVANSYTASDEGKVVSSGLLVSQTTRNVSANGTYDTTTNNSVAVEVLPNIGTKTVTANGTYTASADQLDGYSSVTVNVASSVTSNDSESLSYMAYKNGKTIFDVETGYYILPKIEATATAGRSTWNVHLYAPDGTDVETFSCGIQTTDADIVKYDFAGFGVTINEQHTAATGRGYVKYLPSSSFLSSSTGSNNLLNYFAGNQGYIVGDIPPETIEIPMEVGSINNTTGENRSNQSAGLEDCRSPLISTIVSEWDTILVDVSYYDGYVIYCYDPQTKEYLGTLNANYTLERKGNRYVWFDWTDRTFVRSEIPYDIRFVRISTQGATTGHSKIFVTGIPV